MSQIKPDEDYRQRTDGKQRSGTDEPWKGPTEKEQFDRKSPKPDLEKWHESGTH